MTLEPANTCRTKLSRWRALFGIVAGGVGLVLVSVVWYTRHPPPAVLWQQIQPALQAKDWDAVEETIRRLEDLGADSYARALRGEMLYRQEKFHAARKELRQVEEPTLRVRALALAGFSAYYLGERRDAAQLLSQAVDAQTTDVDVFRVLASIAYDQGQLTQAVEYLRRVAELAPTDGQPHRLIGLIGKDLDRPSDAIDAYQEALRRNLPQRELAAVQVELAEMLLRQNRPEEALTHLNDVAQTDATISSEPLTEALRGEALIAMGNTTEAASLLDAAVQRHPNSADLHRVRGQLCLQTNQVADAVRWLQQATRLDPFEYRNFYVLGLALQRANRPDEANAAQAKVKELQAMLQQLTDLSNEAMSRPWDAAVRRRLAQLCRSLGKNRLADSWDQAAEACLR